MKAEVGFRILFPVSLNFKASKITLAVGRRPQIFLHVSLSLALFECPHDMAPGFL